MGTVGISSHVLLSHFLGVCVCVCVCVTILHIQHPTFILRDLSVQPNLCILIEEVLNVSLKFLAVHTDTPI